MEQFGDYHSKWLVKHHPRLLLKPEDFEDAEQHLLLETLRKDRISKYDSTKRRKYGDGKDTPGLFLHWMGQCFANDMRSLHSSKRGLRRRVNENAVSVEQLLHGVLKEDHSNDDWGSLSDRLSGLSQNYRLKTKREGEMTFVQAQIAQFKAFVAKYRPDLLPALDNLDAAPCEPRAALNLLARQMAAGIKPLRKRKPYVRKTPYIPRKARWTAEQVAELAAKRMRAVDAAVILGCSKEYIGELTRRLHGTNWKGLVRRMTDA
jgi:hypothetical protein